MPTYYDSTSPEPKKTKKVSYKHGGKTVAKTVARGSGAARTQYFRKNG